MRKRLSLEEIKEALLSNVSQLTITERADLMSTKNRKHLIKKIKKYSRKYGDSSIN